MEQPPVPLSAMGIDVARGGEDQTVISKRYGNWFAPLDVHPGSATSDGQSVARLVMEQIENGVVPAIDVIGVGSAAYDIMVLEGINVEPVNFAEGSDEYDKSGQLGFMNKRAECYWRLRELLDPANEEKVALPQDRELRADLCAARWKMSTRGIQIESKDDIRKRLGRSPDRADAIVLAARPNRELRWEWL